MTALSLCLLAAVATGSHAVESSSACVQDTKRQMTRANELTALVKADQEERQDWQNKTSDALAKLGERDLARRKRVGEIFGEGCFATAADYATAALIYQHGDSPDHFFQTFIWARRAVELGDPNQERMVALGLDRYLVNTGRKQLFGSQASKVDACWCLSKVERSFPDGRRANVTGKNLAQAFAWLKELNAKESCPNTECGTELKPTPKGSVPGYW